MIKKILEFAKRGLSDPKKALEFLKDNFRFKVFKITSESYIEAYRKRMQTTILEDPMKGIGGWRKGIGKLQFEFLKDQGLQPSNTLLDIGCGSLRGGRYFIHYLKPGNYTGIDISKEAIDVGKKIIPNELLEEKSPDLFVNDDLRFKEFSKTFDYILAQSVFTHLPGDKIKECFNHVSQIMNSETVFYATFNLNKISSMVDEQIYIYNKSFLKKLAKKSDLKLNFVAKSEYNHPRNQRMAKITTC